MAIQIDSISHKVGDVYGSTKDYFYGNIGDKVTTVVTFTTDAAIAAVDFYFGFVDNNVDYYPLDVSSPASYQIPLSYFNNKHTGQLQRFTGTTASMTAAFPTTQTGTCVLANVAGNQYTITLVHRLNPFVEPENKNGNNYVKTDFSNPLRFVCQVDGKTDALDPTIPTGYSTSEVDCSAVFKKGTTGTFGEQFATGITALHTLTTFTISTPGAELDPNQDSPCSGQITTTGADYTTSTKLFLRIQKVKEATDFEQTDTYLVNTEFEEVALTANGTPVSGTYLKSVTASVNANPKKIDFTFTVDSDYFGGNEEDYILYFSVANNTSPDHNNVLLSLSTSDAVADESVFVEQGDIYFRYHYDKNGASPFNHVKSMIEDRLISTFEFQNTDSNRTVVNSIQVGCKRSTTNQVLESVTVLSSELNYDSDRSFQVDAGDLFIRRSIDLTDGGVYTPTDTYNIIYAFQIWTNFVQFTDVVLFIRVNFTQSGITDAKEWQSPNFEIYSYELPQNTGTIGDPIVTFTDIKLLNPSDSSEVKKIIRDGITVVRAEFESNINDLESIEDDLVGYIGLNVANGSQNIYYQAHNLYGWKTGAPFIKPSGHVTDTSKITKLTAGTGKIEVQIDETLMRSLLPQATFYRVSARIDRADPPALGYAEISWHFRTGGLESPVLDLAVIDSYGDNLQSLQEVVMFTDFDSSALTYQYNTTNTWGTPEISTTNFGNFIGQIAPKTTGFVRIVSADGNFVDGGIIFRYALGSTPAATINLALVFPAGGMDNEIWQFFDEPISITSLTSSSANDKLYYQVRTNNPGTESWLTWTAYTNAAAFNAAIPTTGNYALGVKFESNANVINSKNSSRTITLTGLGFTDTALARVRVAVVDSWVNSQFSYRSYGNALEFERDNTNYLQSSVALNSTFISKINTSSNYYMMMVLDFESTVSFQVLVAFTDGNTESQIFLGDTKIIWDISTPGNPDQLLSSTDNIAMPGKVIIQLVGVSTFTGSKLYVNGQLQGTRSSALLGTWNPASLNLFFGRGNSAANYLDAKVVYFKMVSGTVTDEQLRKDYNQGQITGTYTGNVILDVDFDKTTGNPVTNTSDFQSFTLTHNGVDNQVYSSFY